MNFCYGKNSDDSLEEALLGDACVKIFRRERAIERAVRNCPLILKLFMRKRPFRSHRRLLIRHPYLLAAIRSEFRHIMKEA